MTRRHASFASLVLLLLAGCATYGDGYYRDGYYRDGGYYYPAEDGYGDYYAGPDYDYYDYGYSTYTPFWGLDRYRCGAWASCSPYWNTYYGRPYSGWSLSFGSHWSYGYWGWYGGHWAPWYGPGYYGGYYRPRPPHHHPRPDPRPDPEPDVRPPRNPPGTLPPHLRPGEGRPGPYRPPGGVNEDNWRPGNRGEPPVRAMPRSDFHERPRKPPPEGGPGPRPEESAVPGGNRPPVREPIGRPTPPPVRYERPPVRDTARPQPPREPRPGLREAGRPSPSPDYQRPAPRPPAAAPPRFERPPPREMAPPPRAERAPVRESRPASQNRDREDER